MTRFFDGHGDAIELNMGSHYYQLTMRALFIEVIRTLVYLEGFYYEAAYELSHGFGVKDKAGLATAFEKEWEAAYSGAVGSGTFRSLRYLTRNVVASLSRKFSMSISPPELDYWGNAVINALIDSSRLYDDVNDALTSLSNKALDLYVLTNLDNDIAKKILLKHDILRFFRGVISSDLTRIGKPSIKIFNVAINKAGVNKEEALIVSGLTEDIIGSKLSQIRMAFVNRDNITPTPQPDYVVKDLNELLSII